MIGYRGCYRYVRDPEVFRLELEVLESIGSDADRRADSPRMGAVAAVQDVCA